MNDTILLFAMLILGQKSIAQSEKTLIKSIGLQGAANLTFRLGGEIELKQWNEKFIRIITRVESLNFEDSYLKILASLGRYDIQTTQHPNSSTIIAPQIQNTVSVEGIGLKERLTFKIFIPKDINTQICC